MENKEKPKISPLELGFVNVTGWDEFFLFGEMGRIQRAPEEKIGVYNSNNGVLAVVDERRQIYIRKYNPLLETVLKDSGYEQDGLYVPFSNDCGKKINSLFSGGF